MRIEKLYAKAFGPCTDLTLDFSGANGALHVIYGPNEAGKSSLLRAVEALLFGIPQQSKDNFRHDHQKMRVGALLSRSDGEKLEFLRRKGHKNVFLEMDDRTALPDDALAGFCGPLDEKLFTGMFFVTHESLRVGGRDMLSGGGDLGPLLFEAGTGILGLRKKVEEFDEAARALFLPRATNPRINRAVRAYDEAREAAKRLSADSAEWTRLRVGLETASANERQFRSDRDAADRDLVRLRRIHQNLPSITERNAWIEELKSLAAIPDLPDSSTAERSDAERRLLLAESQRKGALRERDELQKKLDQIAIPPVLLERTEIVEQLHQDLGSYRDAARDLPHREDDRLRETGIAEGAMRELRPGAPVDSARSVRDDLRALRPEILRLIKQRARVEADLAAASERARDAARELAERRAALEALPAPMDVTRLQTAIAEVQGFGALEEQARKARQERGRLERLVGDAAAALPLVAHLSRERIQRLAVPSDETVKRFERAADELRSQWQAAEQAASRAQADEQEGMRTLERLRAGGDVPTAARLDDSRRRRDLGWRLVRAAYVERTRAADEAAAAFDPARPLPDAYEASVEDADRVVDLMRLDSERVGKYEQVSTRVEQVRQDLAAARERIADLERRRAANEAAWMEVWAPLEIQPLPLSEMRDWLRKHALLLGQIEQMNAAAVQENDLAGQTARCRGLLDGALREMALPAALDSETLTALLTRCRSLADGLAESATRRRTLEEGVRDLEVKLTSARQGEGEAQGRLESWRASWKTAAVAFNQAADAETADVEQALARLEQLGKAIERIDDFEKRIQKMEATVAEYRTRVAALVAEVDPELVGQPPGDAVSIVYQRAQEVKLLDERRRNLQKDLERKKQSIDGADEEIRRCQATLETLRRAARCDAVEQLPDVERKSARKKALHRRIEERNGQLVQASRHPLEELLAEASTEDPDALPTRIAEREEQRFRLEQELKAAMETAAQSRAELNAIDGSDRAADKAQEAQAALAEIRDAVDDYVRLKLSADLLHRAVEEYRQNNQAPLLKRAAELFPALTRGSFATLRSAYDEKDRPILVGERGDGEQVTVSGMSDGTVDQLYLAIRLAAIERQQASGEPMPVILDDILVHFDDDRSRATLTALTELSRVTQVLFFTHHQHLVDLAEEALPPQALHVHRLDGRMAVPTEAVSVN